MDTARIAIAATRGILVASHGSRLEGFGGHVQLNRHWVYSFLKRIKFVKQKVTMTKSKHLTADFVKLKKQFSIDIVATVEMKV